MHKEREPPPPLLRQYRFTVNGIAFIEPVGYARVNGQGITFFSKQCLHQLADPVSEIIKLLYMPVLVDSQGVGPSKTALVKIVDRRGHIKFAAIRPEPNVTI